MRKLIVAVLLAASTATAEDGPFLKGEALQAEIAKNCAGGCIVLSPQETQALQAQILRMVQQAQMEAYQAGKLSCRNAV